MVRIPPELHRNLVIDAHEQGISLNRLVSAKLQAWSFRLRNLIPNAAPCEIDSEGIQRVEAEGE